MPKSMVEEGELMVAGQSREPKRELSQINGHLVLVHTIQATLRHEPASMKELVFVRWKRWRFVVLMPSVNQCVSKLAAGLHKKRTRTHCWIAYLERQDLLRFWVVTQVPEDWI